MSEVSVPPTHPDDELVTRKILREELAKHPAHEDLAKHPTQEDLAAMFRAHEETMGRALKAMEESIISKMVTLVEPQGSRETDHRARGQDDNAHPADRRAGSGPTGSTSAAQSEAEAN